MTYDSCEEDVESSARFEVEAPIENEVAAPVDPGSDGNGQTEVVTGVDDLNNNADT